MSHPSPRVSMEALLEAAFLARDNPVFVVEWQSRRILAASDAVERVFGYRPAELLHCTTELLHVDPDSFRRFGTMTEAGLASGKQTFHCYFRMKRRGGATFDAENLLGVIRDETGTPVAAVSVVCDLSESGSLALPGSALRIDLEALNDNLPGSVFQRVRRPDGTLFYNFLRGNLAQRFGISPEQARQDPEVVLRRLHPEDRRLLHHAMASSAVTLSSVDIELRVYTGDGTLRWLRSISQPRRLDDGSIVWDGILIDVTEQRKAETELRHLAMYDLLTGLPNIATFDERLGDAVVHARRSGARVLVAAVDIHRFHAVNESLGFHYGDSALRRIARRLQSITAGNDLAARYQGDKFVLLFQDIRGRQDANTKVHELISLFDAPLDLGDGRQFPVKTRIGLSVYPDDGLTAEALRRAADLALHRARKDSELGYEFYSTDMTREVLHSLELERALEIAIKDRTLEAHYQPQYDLASGRLTGFEALARWPRANGGVVAPAEFIPLAEKTGLIATLGELVAQKVLADLNVWHQQGLNPPRVAVNLSAHQIRRPGLFQWLSDTLLSHGLDVNAVTIEITESAFLFHFQDSRKILDELAANGLRLAIDDFGTGFSSLSYLSDLPFQELKIDRSFIAEIGRDSAKRAVTRGIVELGHALGLTVIAEGVETENQASRLRSIGCDAAQGYLFGRPTAARDIPASVWSGAPHPVLAAHRAN